MVKRTSNSNLLETKFKIVKTMFKLIKQKEGLETKILALVSRDLDEQKKRKRLRRERSLTEANGGKVFVKTTNERMFVD